MNCGNENCKHTNLQGPIWDVDAKTKLCAACAFEQMIETLNNATAYLDADHTAAEFRIIEFAVDLLEAGGPNEIERFWRARQVAEARRRQAEAKQAKQHAVEAKEA